MLSRFVRDQIVTSGKTKPYKAKFIEDVLPSRYRVLMLEGPQAGQIVTVPSGYIQRIK